MMYTYTVYKTATGEIEYTTSGVAHESDIPLETGFSIMEGSYSATEYIISDGEAVLRTDNVLAKLRLKRDVLLYESDWTQMSDSPLTDAKKTEWATYRQSLRDAPVTNASITNIDDAVWPTKPQ